MTSTLEQAIDQAQHRSALSRLANVQVFWVFVAAVAACVALSLLTDSFATQRNLYNVSRNFAFVAIIAIGMTAVIASGGIDLSVGSSVVLSAMVISVLMENGNSFWLSALAAIGVALLVGLINGVLIAYVGMPAFVVTLGMLSAARSAARAPCRGPIRARATRRPRRRAAATRRAPAAARAAAPRLRASGCRRSRARRCLRRS